MDLVLTKRALIIGKSYIDEADILMVTKRIISGKWEMTGPCGPCSKFILISNEEERRKVRGKTWSIKTTHRSWKYGTWCFMQFDRKSDGHLDNLPCSAHRHRNGLRASWRWHLQGKCRPITTRMSLCHLIDHLAKKAGVEYGEKGRD